MKLLEKNFNKVKGTCLYKGQACSLTYHSYESETKLYDVLVVELPNNSTVKLYETNRKSCGCGLYHKAIEKHYNI